MHYLYLCTIYPLELAYTGLYAFLIGLTSSYGASLLLLSLAITVATAPLKKLTASLQAEEKHVTERMAPFLAQIRATLHGAERQAAINRLYRRFSYHPLMALRSSVGLLIPVPFLIAAFYMIEGFTPLAGQPFGPIADLSRPDGLLGPVNLLPLLMTAINVAAVCTTPGFGRRDRVQALFVAGLFLVLLYAMPSALLVYWTFNNALFLAGNFLSRSPLAGQAAAVVGRVNQFSLATALLAAFALFIYFPFAVYLRNVNEFAFGGLGLLAGVARPFLVAAAACYALLALAGRVLPRHEVKWLGRARPVTATHVAMLFALLAALFEGIFLSRGLPRLTGEAGLFDSAPRLAVDSAIWLALIGLPLVFRRDALEALPRLVAVSFLVMLLGLVDAYRAGPPKLPVALTADEVRQELAFSREGNVIFIMADSFPTETAKAILARRPEVAAKFTGFTLFVNNLGAGGGTEYAIPQILRGKLWSEGDILDFTKATLKDPEGMPRRFKERGYDVFISSKGLPWANAAWVDGRELSEGLIKFSFNGHEYKRFLFGFAPYICKRLWNEDLALSQSAAKAEAGHILDTKVDALYQDMARGAALESKRPTLHYHLYNGVHAPYAKDADGTPLPKEERFADSGLLKAGEWELKSCGQYLDFLKEAGLYDSSTIILMADHGRGDEHRFPLFMVKPAGANGELAYSEAPTSGLYVKDMAEWLADGRSLADWAASLPETRQQCAPPDKYFGEVRGVDKGQLIFGDEREIKVDTRE